MLLIFTSEVTFCVPSNIFANNFLIISCFSQWWNLVFLGLWETFLLSRVTYLQESVPAQFQHAKERNHKAFCFINNFKNGIQFITSGLLSTLTVFVECCTLVEPRRILCASDTYHRKVLSLQERVLHMEYINKKRNTDFSCDNSLHESRFKTTISFLRLSGIPHNITSLSHIAMLYYTVCAVCYYTTFICILMDTYVHRYDLMQGMKKIRLLGAYILCEWIHLSLRYPTHILRIYRNVLKT